MVLSDINEISVIELNEQIQNCKDNIIIDVRELFEYEICRLEHAVLMPLSSFEEEVQSLDKTKSYVVMCKLGGRSSKAAQLMLDLGFKNVRNLKGGIIEWAEKIDQSLSIY